jgi:hypothetical protein
MVGDPIRRNLVIRYADCARFDPGFLRERIEVGAAEIDLAAVYTWQAEHAGTLYLWLGCIPEADEHGHAAFDLAKASCIVAGPVGWTGGALWPSEFDDQPPGPEPARTP